MNTISYRAAVDRFMLNVDAESSTEMGGNVLVLQ